MVRIQAGDMVIYTSVEGEKMLNEAFRREAQKQLTEIELDVAIARSNSTRYKDFANRGVIAKACGVQSTPKNDKGMGQSEPEATNKYQ